MTHDEWNEKYSPGQAVILTDDLGVEHRTRTRSPAWPLGHGTPVVLVEGRTGGWELERVRPIEETA